MPLTQRLPSSYTSQKAIAQDLNANVSFNDYIISQTGAQFSTTGKVYIPMPFPYVNIAFLNSSNDGSASGSAAVATCFASNTAVKTWGSIIAAESNASGYQYRSITLALSDLTGVSFKIVKTGTVKLHIVVSGVVDSGLLPYPEINENGLDPNMRIREFAQMGSKQLRIQPGGGSFAGGQGGLTPPSP